MAEPQHTAASDDAQRGHVLSNQQLKELMTKTARKTVAKFSRASRPPVSETNATAEGSGLLNMSSVGALFVHVAVCPT